jgi:hypothetical protein
MTAVGHKRKSSLRAFDVRFAPVRGHQSGHALRSALCHERTSAGHVMTSSGEYPRARGLGYSWFCAFEAFKACQSVTVAKSFICAVSVYRSISRSIASRSMCERSSNLSSTSSTRARVPTSIRKKRLSENLDPDVICRLLDFLGIAVLFTQMRSPYKKGRQVGGLPQHLSLLVQANDTLRRDCLKAKPSPAKPSSIMAHVEGSGTPDVMPTLVNTNCTSL